MVWHVDATQTPTGSATQLAFTATSAYHDAITVEMRVNGSGLSYNPLTGAFAGTIDTIEFHDMTNDTAMVSINVDNSIAGTLATDMTAFGADVVDMSAAIDQAFTAGSISGFDHFGTVTEVSAGLVYRVAVMGVGPAPLGYLQITGTNLSANIAGVTAGDEAVVSKVELLNTSFAAVGGSSTTFAPQASFRSLSYAIGQMDPDAGNESLFYGMLMSGNDTLTGTGGDDVLDGGIGNDSMSGGDGDDTYYVDATNVNTKGDSITEATNNGFDTVISTASYVAPANVENIILVGSGHIDATGNTLDNILAGNSGNNKLNGGIGDGDIASYEFATAAVTVSISTVATTVTNSGSGTDTLQNIEGLRGSDFNDTLKVLAGSASNYLDGGAGNDTLTGGGGNDVYVVDSAEDSIVETSTGGVADQVLSSASTYTLDAYVEKLKLIDGKGNIDGVGNSLNNTLEGNEGANKLSGAGGNDILIGGAGDDEMTGGLGNDTYFVDSTDDVIVEAASQGTDVVYADVDYTISADVETLILNSAGATKGTGNAGANTIIGNSGDNELSGEGGNDILDGGAGNDTMMGGSGNDTYIVDSADDIVDEGANSDSSDTVKSSIIFDLSDFTGIENLTLTGSAHIDATGNDKANIITGNSGDNVIDSGADALIDILAGGAGNDTYHVRAGDKITEVAAGGTNDSVIAYADYTLSLYVENLTLEAASGDIKGTGNTSNNVIIGNNGNNTILGSGGNDTINGGEGTNILKGDAGIDTISYAGAASGVTVSLLKTTQQNTFGTTLDTISTFENVTGSSHDDNLTGTAAANVIDGGAGNDVMTGGAGNDIYYVDSADDEVLELVTGGTGDTVLSTVSYDLTVVANIEHLTLIGGDDVDATGNQFNNILTGNSGANKISGGAGNDTLDGGEGVDELTGGAGNDIYFVDDALDLAVEVTGEGTDLVKSTASSYVLGDHVENLTLLGTAAINGTGNSGVNTILGNTGANTLDGGAGDGVVDQLKGGGGNDTYIVETGDVVTELSGQGTADTVQTALDGYTLTNYVENLVLTGSGNIGGNGNSLANVLTGNDGENALNGGAGNDTLNGGLGNDTLTGGTGKDTFVFDSALGASNIDSISGYTVADDVIKLDKDVFTGLTSGASLGLAAFVIGSAAVDASDRIIYDSSNGKIYFDQDGNGATHSAIHFATVAAGTALTAAEFFVIA